MLLTPFLQFCNPYSEHNQQHQVESCKAGLERLRRRPQQSGVPRNGVEREHKQRVTLSTRSTIHVYSVRSGMVVTATHNVLLCLRPVPLIESLSTEGK